MSLFHAVFCVCVIFYSWRHGIIKNIFDLSSWHTVPKTLWISQVIDVFLSKVAPFQHSRVYANKVTYDGTLREPQNRAGYGKDQVIKRLALSAPTTDLQERSCVRCRLISMKIFEKQVFLALRLVNASMCWESGKSQFHGDRSLWTLPDLILRISSSACSPVSFISFIINGYM